MANRVRLRITGLAELRQAVADYGERLVQASVDAVTAATEATVRDARAAAPVGVYPPSARRQGGALRDSIEGTVSTTAYGARGVVRARAPHAHLIEFGTVRAAATPFLVPAAITARRTMQRALAQAVQDEAPEGLGRPRVTGATDGTPGVVIG